MHHYETVGVADSYSKVGFEGIRCSTKRYWLSVLDLCGTDVLFRALCTSNTDNQEVYP